MLSHVGQLVNYPKYLNEEGWLSGPLSKTTIYVIAKSEIPKHSIWCYSAGWAPSAYFISFYFKFIIHLFVAL